MTVELTVKNISESNKQKAICEKFEISVERVYQRKSQLILLLIADQNVVIPETITIILNQLCAGN